MIHSLDQQVATLTRSPPALAKKLGEHLGEDGTWLAVMAVLAAVEGGWWLGVWISGVAPAPLVLNYILLAAAGLAAAMGLRLALRMPALNTSVPVVAIATVVIAIGASMFLPLKFAIPSEVPFWLDDPIAAGERAFFGADPWMIVDQWLGAAILPMDWLYGCWLPVQLVVLFLTVLAKPSRMKTRSLIAYGLAWFLLGAVAAMLLSSVGPIFHDRIFGGDAFRGLEDMLHRRRAGIALAESNRMWVSLNSERPGLVAGISAMPSIHVAVSLWIWLMARSLYRRAAVAALAYFVLIWVGSVQLGWHYVSDGFVGALGMLAVWALAGVLENALHTRRSISPADIIHLPVVCPLLEADRALRQEREEARSGPISDMPPGEPRAPLHILSPGGFTPIR